MRCAIDHAFVPFFQPSVGCPSGNICRSDLYQDFVYPCVVRSSRVQGMQNWAKKDIFYVYYFSF